MYDDRYYIIFNVSEIYKINFDQVLETSNETLRRSVDNTLTFVKWDGETPSCVLNLTTKQGPYSHTEMLDILDGPDWFVSYDSVL